MQAELEGLRCIVAVLERRILPVKQTHLSIQTDPKLSSTAAELDVAEKVKHLRAELELESVNRRRSVDKLLRRASDLEKENRRLVGIIHQLRKNSSAPPVPTGRSPYGGGGLSLQPQPATTPPPTTPSIVAASGRRAPLPPPPIPLPTPLKPPSPTTWGRGPQGPNGAGDDLRSSTTLET